MYVAVIGQVAFNERFNSFSQAELDSKSRSSNIIAAAFGSNVGINKLDRGFMWKLFKTPMYKKFAESQSYLEKYAFIIQPIPIRRTGYRPPLTGLRCTDYVATRVQCLSHTSAISFADACRFSHCVFIHRTVYGKCEIKFRTQSLKNSEVEQRTWVLERRYVERLDCHGV